MESGSNTNCLVLRRDLKPAALCEFEATSRKANTARTGPGKISVRKFMQGKFLPLSRYTTLPPPRISAGFLNLYRNIKCGINCFIPQGFERRSDVFVCAHMVPRRTRQKPRARGHKPSASASGVSVALANCF